MKLTKKQVSAILKLKPVKRRIDGRPPLRMIAEVEKWKGKKNVPAKIAYKLEIYKIRIHAREIQSGVSAGLLAKKYGVNPSTIYRIWQGKIGK